MLLALSINRPYFKFRRIIQQCPYSPINPVAIEREAAGSQNVPLVKGGLGPDIA
jgi:hypothetical protein